jgi:uncharacterized membrane protein
MAHAALHIGWNVFLALVAVGLAHLLAAEIRGSRRLVWVALTSFAWVLMLPNTCYLFTEVRHLFEAIEERDIWSRASRSSAARVGLALHGFVVAMYGAAGALTFGLAIRPVREAIEARGIRTRAWMLAFFTIVALGVYLGLVQRLNSWDVLTRPERVLVNAIDAVRAPRRMLAVALGGVALWTIYEIVDVWIDGARLRLGLSPPRRAPSDARAPA